MKNISDMDMDKPIPKGWYVVKVESRYIFIKNTKSKRYPGSEKWKSKICSEKIWNAEIGVKYVGCSRYCLFLQSLLLYPWRRSKVLQNSLKFATASSMHLTTGVGRRYRLYIVYILWKVRVKVLKEICECEYTNVLDNECQCP